MSDISSILNKEVYPIIYNNIETVFSEFGFKKTRFGYQSTTTIKIDGSTGKAGKVYCYKNNPFGLQDYTRGFISFWDYVKESQRINENKDVLKALCNLAGYNLPSINKKSLEELKSEYTINSIYEAINGYFTNNLTTSKSESKYLMDKAQYYIDNYIIIGLGCFNSLQGLRTHLSKNYSLQDVTKVLDTFPKFAGKTNTLSIAYRDHYGKIKGFSFRDINYTNDSKNPKYIYTKGSFRNDILFNLSPLKMDSDLVVLESPIDAKLGSTFGFECNFVALGGTSINSKQIELIKQIKPQRITLYLDNDVAGQKATFEIIKKLSFAGFERIYICDSNDFKDLGETFENKDIEEVKQLIQDAYKLSKYFLSKIIDLANQGINDKEIDNIKDVVLSYSLLINDRFDRNKFFQLIEEGFNEFGINKATLKDREQELEEIQQNKRLKSRLLSNINKQHEAIKSGNVEEVEKLQKDAKNLILESNTINLDNLLIPITQDSIKNELQSIESLRTGLYLEGQDGKEEIFIPSGQLSYIVGATGHGKTMVLTNLMLEMADLYPNKEFYLLSIEMTKGAMFLRLLNNFMNLKLSENNLKTLESYFAQGTSQYIKRSVLNEFEELKNRFFNEYLKTRRINIIDSMTTVEEITKLIHHISKSRNAGAIFIDYMQLIRTTKSGRSRQEEMKSIGLDLLSCAKETKLPVMLAAQFNRSGSLEVEEMHETKISEAGDIERQANLILGMFNQYKERKSSNEEVFIKVLKRRGGNPNLEYTFDFNGNTSKINFNS